MNADRGAPREQSLTSSPEDELLAIADAGFEEDLPAHLRRLSDGHHQRLTSLYPHAQMITDIARCLVSAGFELHDCAAHVRSGGVCLTPCSAKPGVIGHGRSTMSSHSTMPGTRRTLTFTRS
jgi:hypothetical protein